jgi:uncharacterized protein YcbX
MVVVTELYSYPVKGCAGVRLSEAALTRAGLAYDRTFMVIDERGVFRSQRRDRRLATIQPEVGEDGARLTLRAPGRDPVGIDVDLDAERRDVELFGSTYRGIDQGETVARWLSELLGTPSRLVRVPPEHERLADGWIPGTSGYADSSPVLLICRAGLTGLNARIEGQPVPMGRFRPNIVVDGTDEPHLEDRFRRIAIGNGELGFAKLAIRCSVTLVDQHTGERAGPEPLRTLATYRRVPEGGVAFGAKFSVTLPGKLAVGDEALVTEWKQ